MAPPVSVIIPLKLSETAWQRLIGELALPPSSEIILAAGGLPAAIERGVAPEGIALRICTTGKGRAGQMNAGADLAAHEWLWFLHADSRPGEGVFEALARITGDKAPALYFFDLRFLADGPTAMRLNEWAVGWRAGVFGLPFGDQGFVIRKDVFERLGGYREDATYGEDHLLVWAAKRQGIPVKRAGAALFTSARKYRDRGWLGTTVLHVWLTIRQAVPQMAMLIWERIKGRPR